MTRETEIHARPMAKRLLAGKVALINTASGAIDADAVRALVEAGATVVVMAPDEERLAAVADQIRAAPE